ncbi:hypothetical protein ZYGR_0BQ00110 [Zygosaccharomyces rouxii]|uniref:Protein RTA1 n=1 Tax=Zygosaccharomyces rouxii TaxID=4956 RepID=A0A1Q3ALJ5_ZYGRO|nr:hypothetical protein ZYGR_0BQ00110 [Zygosaccharomyces rouxii]
MQYYSYTPDRAAAIAFAILFGPLAVISIFFIIRMTRNMKDYMVPRQYTKIQLLGSYLPFAAGCTLELIGYAARCCNPDSLAPYIIQSVLILIAPAFYAATIYMLFGRIAHLLFAEELLIMPAKYNTRIFVLGDVVSLCLQSGGGGLMASQSSAKIGSHIVIVGLFFQLAFFGLFIINEFLFLMNIHKVPSEFARPTRKAVFLNNLLLFGSILIFIRSVVRTAEFIEGSNGTIMTHEWFLYVFDTTPMFLTSLIYMLSMPWCNIVKIQEESAEVQGSSDAADPPLKMTPADIDMEDKNDFEEHSLYIF